MVSHGGVPLGFDPCAHCALANTPTEVNLEQKTFGVMEAVVGFDVSLDETCVYKAPLPTPPTHPPNLSHPSPSPLPS